MRGTFITFEGIDGSGKTTQLSLLADALRAAGREVLVTREPGGTPLGKRIREVLLDPAAEDVPAPRAELFLFLADRAQHVARVIEPALAAGTWVLSDRFADSTLVYQGYGRGLLTDRIAALNLAATGELVPDLTFVLDLEPGLARLRLSRGGREFGGDDRMEQEAELFHQRVRAGYQALAELEPARVRLLPAAQAPESLHAAVLDAVLGRTAERGAEGGHG